MIVPRTTTSKHYPGFIRKNKSLLKFSKQKKVFERIGLPNCESAISKTHRIVFSAAGNKGLWDIATMSMRGVRSCQRWGNWHAHALVGSMMDPYCGIIYITNGNEFKFGEKMLQRALVRFVVHRRTGQPALMIERIYPRSEGEVYRRGPDGYWRYITDPKEKRNKEALNFFIDFLKKKTNNKISIITHNGTGYSIPMSNSVSRLTDDNHSYRDSGIGYRKFPKYNAVSKVNL